MLFVKLHHLCSRLSALANGLWIHWPFVSLLFLTYRLLWKSTWFAYFVGNKPVIQQTSVFFTMFANKLLLRTFAPKTSHTQILLKLWLQVENDKIRLKTFHTGDFSHIFRIFLTTPPVFGHARKDLWVEFRTIPRWTLRRSGAYWWLPWGFFYPPFAKQDLIPNSTILGTFSTFSLYLKVEDKLYYFLEIFDCVCGQFYLI